MPPHLPQPRPWLAPLLIVALFAAAALAFIFTAHNQGRQAFDQNNFHLKAIERFSAQWPHMDFSDYEVASTPGYHVALAAVHRFISTSVTTLQLFALPLSLALVLTLSLAIALRAPPLTALALAIPLAASPYIFSSAAYLLPENTAWLLITLILLIALSDQLTLGRYVLAGALLCLLVLVRQSAIWIAAPLWLAALLPTTGASRAEFLKPQAPSPKPLLPFLLSLLSTLPAFIILALFYLLWHHGLTPPSFQPSNTNPIVFGATNVGGLNCATPPFILALIGVLGLFFAPFILPTIRTLTRREVAITLAAALVTGALSAIPVTSYSLEAGRYGGLWILVQKLPLIADRSPLIIILAALGAIHLTLWFIALARAGRTERFIFALTLAAFTAAQTAGSLAWQRYCEPLLLILFALAASRLPYEDASEHRPPRAAFLAPLLLALALAAITWRTVL